MMISLVNFKKNFLNIRQLYIFIKTKIYILLHTFIYNEYVCVIHSIRTSVTDVLNVNSLFPEFKLWKRKRIACNDINHPNRYVKSLSFFNSERYRNIHFIKVLTTLRVFTATP